MSMAIRPEDLPSDPARLIEMVLSLDAENDRLRGVIDTFKDMVFGSRSEKLAAVVGEQLALDRAYLATDVRLPAACTGPVMLAARCSTSFGQSCGCCA